MITQLNTWVCLGDSIADLPDHATSPRGIFFVDQSTGVLYVNEVTGWISVSGGGAAAFPLTSDVSANGFKITDLGAPTPGSNDAANAAYVDAAIAEYTIINVRDYGATGDGVTDDAPAFRAASDAARTNVRSLILVPAGTYRMASIDVTLNAICEFGDTNPAFYYRWVLLLGEGSASKVFMDLGNQTHVGFSFGNLYQGRIDNLTFVGNPNHFSDVGNVLYGVNTFQNFIVSHCLFAGVGASSIVQSYGSRMQLEFCHFAASAGTVANVLAANSVGTRIENCNFEDIATFPGIYQKVGTGPNQTIPPAWILADTVSDTYLGFSVEHCMLDENALQAIVVNNTSFPGVTGRSVRIFDSFCAACAIPAAIGVPVIQVSNIVDVVLDSVRCKELSPGSVQRPGMQFRNIGNVILQNCFLPTVANDCNTIDADNTVGSVLLDRMARATNYRTLTSTAAATVVRPRPDGAPYTTVGRPAAADVPGFRILNTDTNKQNFSDGTDWRDAAGAVV